MKKIAKNIKKINEIIALKSTMLIGTMWCVYLFIILAIVPIFVPSANTIVQYISSAFLQLVFLPLIMVGQDVMGRNTEKRAKKDHEMIMQELKLLKEMHENVKNIKPCPHI